ncbi:MAG: hypothetical protein HWE25_10255 [Alphaproteobacteria bacterium]|nr:hypothetical protein [Alphaproteobacteria bacterium]
MMSDDKFLAAFEAATLDEKLFDHEAHIRMGWIYVTRYPLAEAIDRFAAALKNYTRALGCEAKYHETITWFYMLLIHERQTRQQTVSFTAFLDANADLISKPSILLRYYKAETLASDRARTHYMLPDNLEKKAAA